MNLIVLTPSPYSVIREPRCRPLYAIVIIIMKFFLEFSIFSQLERGKIWKIKHQNVDNVLCYCISPFH